MKKLILVFTIIATALQGFATEKDKANNNETAKVSMLNNKQGVYELYYRNKSNSKVTVNLLDAKRKVLFTESLRNVNAFVRPYNLNALKDGIYYLQVMEGNKVVSTETILHGNITTILEPSLETIKFTQLKRDSNLVMVTLIKAGDQSAEIEVLNDKNEVIYNSTEAFENTFAKLYNLNKVEGIKYINVTVSGSTETYTIK